MVHAGGALRAARGSMQPPGLPQGLRAAGEWLGGAYCAKGGGKEVKSG